MSKSSANFLSLSESLLNSLKKLELVQEILDLKGNVIANAELQKLSDQKSKLTEAIDQISLENSKLRSELVITQNVNTMLEEKIINLEKNQANGEQYSKRNNVELSGIPNRIPDEDLDYIVINICKESEIDVEVRDIEQCHRLPLSRNSRSHNKWVIVKFVNRKNAEALLKDKKRISSKSFGRLHVTKKNFVSISLCPYYRYNWGKCKDLQKQGKLPDGLICIKLSENGSPVKLLYINDILDFPSDSNIEN